MLPGDQLVRVYLDWNAFQNLIREDFPDLGVNLNRWRDDGLIAIPYTICHLEEATRSLPPEDSAIDEALIGLQLLTAGRLWRLLSDGIAEFRCAVPEVFHQMQAESSPAPAANGDLLERTLTATREALSEMSGGGLDLSDLARELDRPNGPPPTLRAVRDVAHRAIRRATTVVAGQGFSPRSVSGFDPSRVVGVLDERLRGLPECRVDFETVLRYAVDYGRSLGFGPAAAGTASLLLSTLGYRGDGPKVTIESTASDNVHLAFAMGADVFVTRDRRLAARSEAVFAQLGASTRTVAPESARQAISELVAQPPRQRPGGRV